MSLPNLISLASVLDYLFCLVFSALISIGFICAANKKVFDNPLDLLSLTLNAMLDRERSTAEVVQLYFKALQSILVLCLFIIIIFSVVWQGVLALSYVSPSNGLDLTRLDLLFVCIVSTFATFHISSRFFKSVQTEFNIVNRVVYRLSLGNPLQYKFAIKKINEHETKNPKQPDIFFITGLARAGTTTLLHNMHMQRDFVSLVYGNLPFPFLPNLQSVYLKVFRKKPKLSERAHGDSILVDHNSPDAIDELFWLHNSKKKYLKKGLVERHDLSLDDLMKYQSLVSQILENKGGKVYLSKNNNNIVRLSHLSAHFKSSLIVVLFRNPLDQARSLFQQHKRFMAKQENDDFVLEYMSMIGHFEFGFGHKPFFKQPEREDTLDINYWLEIWINSYEEVLLYMQQCTGSETTLLFSYRDLCIRSHEVAELISSKIGYNVRLDQAKFKLKRYERNDAFDQDLVKKALLVYDRLKSYSHLL